MSRPEDRLTIQQRESEQFIHYLEMLSPEAWSTPSACERWTVADVVAHLTFITQGGIPRVHRALHGDASPPEGATPGGSIDEDAFRESLAQQALATRQALEGRLLQEFSTATRALDQALSRVGPHDWGKRWEHPMGPEPLTVMVDMMITEREMHWWDIRSRLDAHTSLHGDCLPALLATLPRAVRRAFRPDPALSTPIRYRFIVTAPLAISSDIVATREGTRIEAASAAPAEVIFRCDTETYVLVLFGRLSPDVAMAEGRMTFEGDQALAAGFGRRFQGG
jgi:uncharacterized protein (TIGR03083 family)